MVTKTAPPSATKDPVVEIDLTKFTTKGHPRQRSQYWNTEEKNALWTTLHLKQDVLKGRGPPSEKNKAWLEVLGIIIPYINHNIAYNK